MPLCVLGMGWVGNLSCVSSVPFDMGLRNGLVPWGNAQPGVGCLIDWGCFGL